MDAPPDVVGRTSAAAARPCRRSEPAGATTSEVAPGRRPRPPDRAPAARPRWPAAGLVDRDPAGRWLLGPELYFLGLAAAARYDVTALAQPVVRRLSVATGESAFFSARRGDETVCLVREDGSFPIRSHVLHEGIRFPLGVASAGLAVLAFLDDAEVEAYLARADLADGVRRPAHRRRGPRPGPAHPGRGLRASTPA